MPTEVHQRFLAAGEKLLSTAGSVAALTPENLAREAGSTAAEFQACFAEAHDYRMALLEYLHNTVRQSAVATLSVKRSTVDRMTTGVTAFLDGSFQHPELRVLTEAMQDNPQAREFIKRRRAGFGVLFKHELSGLGKDDAAELARLCTALIVEVAWAEFEAKKVLPKLRQALFALLTNGLR